MPQEVMYRFWMNNYEQPRYETWESLLAHGPDVIGSYLSSERKDIIKEMCLNLPDKNNKLVYEGDLIVGPVAYQNNQGDKIVRDEVQAVVWFQAGFYFNPIKTSIYHPVNSELLKRCKIIGNVHQLIQDPELQN